LTPCPRWIYHVNSKKKHMRVRGHSKTTWTIEGGWSKICGFVHVYYIKNVHEGRWVVKNDQDYVHVVVEWPLTLILSDLKI
jgi:hypothetical protein